MSSVGEANHRKGADGADRACYWLDATTRTIATWTNEDEVMAGRLTFEWPHIKAAKGKTFSFDIGEILHGDEFHNHLFVAEVKNYSTQGNLSAEFDDFLAKCYVVASTERKLADQFMFITWNPFRATDWSKQTKKGQVQAACLLSRNRERSLGQKDLAKATAALDEEVLEYVEDRLWLVVLSEKQEGLLISDEDREKIMQGRIKRRQR